MAQPKYGIALSIHPSEKTTDAHVVLSTWRVLGDDLVTQMEEFTTGPCPSDTNWSVWVRDVLVEVIERLKD
jgi:hypothetical protein